MNVPSVLNVWTRLLPASATQRFPSPSIATVYGRRNSPGPMPGVPSPPPAPQPRADAPPGRRLLDPVVGLLGDVEVARVVDRHAPRLDELGVAAARRAVAAVLAPAREEAARGRELLDAVVVVVGHVDVPRVVDRHPARARE